MSPEFINRLDDLIIFNSFTDDNFLQIIDLHINELKDRLKSQSIKLLITKPVKVFLSDECAKLKDGARPIGRIIEDKIINPLSEKMLSEKRGSFGSIKIMRPKSEIIFKFS